MYFNDLPSITNTNNQQNNNNMLNQSHYIEEMKEEDVQNSSRVRGNSYQPVSQNENESSGRRSSGGNNRNANEHPGLVDRFLWRPLRWVGSMFCNRNTEGLGNNELNRETGIFADLPSNVNSLQNFTSGIRNKVGLLVLFKDGDLTYFERFIHTLKSQHEYIIDIIVNFLLMYREKII
jgi:hypothetical protein